ncbi:MAG: hypothetical protein C0458_15555 [Methylobacterium sp.]|nr:hypothetical protein [Methylobacterium sp.]
MADHHPLRPNKHREMPRVDDRRILNGILWVLRSGAPWKDLPGGKTCRSAMAPSAGTAREGSIEMIDSTSVRAYQQAATTRVHAISGSDRLILRPTQLRKDTEGEGAEVPGSSICAKLGYPRPIRMYAPKPDRADIHRSIQAARPPV